MKPRRPALPKVSDAGWPRNAIDQFILARLQRETMKPAPEAERAALPEVRHPLVRTHPGSNRRTLYVGSHAANIVGSPIEDVNFGDKVRVTFERADEIYYPLFEKAN